MFIEPVFPPVPLPPVPGSFVRVEYLGFRDLTDHREFRLRAYGRDGSTEFRFSIAIAAFRAARVALQDGPNVCYQKLLRTITTGEMASPDVITIDEAELTSHREAHTPARKHTSWTPQSPTTPPPAREVVRTPAPPALASPPAVDEPAPGLAEGQRVRHAIFGDGVTRASNLGHTAVCFDTGGTRTFVTSMLEVDALSAPHTWETSARGVNRPRPVVASPAE